MTQIFFYGGVLFSLWFCSVCYSFMIVAWRDLHEELHLSLVIYGCLKAAPAISHSLVLFVLF